MVELLKTTHNILSYLPHLFLVVCPVALILFIILGRIDVFLKSSIILIPLALASLLLVISKKRVYTPLSEAGWTINIPKRITSKLYIISTAILIILLLLLGFNDALVLIFIAITYGIIILQMISKELSGKYILTEICITTFLLVIPKLCGNAFYFGDGDLFAHIRLATGIFNTGQLLPSELAGAYTNFFTYHLGSAIDSLVTGLAVNNALYILSLVAAISAFPCIYLLAKIFTSSERVAVFSVFFYSTASILTNEYLMPAPRMMASVAFIFILYLLFSKGISNANLAILSSIIMVYTIFTHHAQLPLILITTVIICLGSILYKRKITIGNLSVLLILFISIIGHLIYTYLTQIVQILSIRLFDKFNKGVVTDTLMTTAETGGFSVNLQSMLTFLSTSVMVIFIMIGLYMLITRVSFSSKIITLLPFTLLLFIAIVPWVLDSVPFISDSLQIYRFRLVFIPLFAVIMGFGCISFLNIMRTLHIKKWIGTTAAVVLCLMLIFATPIMALSTDNDAIQATNIIITDPNNFNEADEAMFIWMPEYISLGETISGEQYYNGYYPSSPSVQHIGLPYYQTKNNMVALFSTDAKVITQHYISFPMDKYKYSNNGLRLDGAVNGYGELKFTYINSTPENDTVLLKNLYSLNKLYNSNSNLIFENR